MIAEQPTQTSEEKIDIDKLREVLDTFYAKREAIRLQINLHTVEISKLEGELVQIRPRIGNGEKLCEICGTISVVFDGPESEYEYWYKCKNPDCGHEYYERYQEQIPGQS